MRKITQILLWGCAIGLPGACTDPNTGPSKEIISQIDLKRGELITCGSGTQLGSVDFEQSCDKKVKPDFNLAMELLHSFEYDEAEKVFAKIIDQTPGCAMAYWGVAMSSFHPLWSPPTEAELQKGEKAIAIARSITKKTKRETAYIEAIGAFYDDRNKKDHAARCIRFEQAMEKLYQSYPADKEAAIFYALALNAAASPTDKSFSKQKKAASILQALFPEYPGHPGIIHYLIHSYDYPGLATLGLPAARKYATVAPASAHALHMPSHIFTRLGLWEECIQSNQVSVSAARCYAESAGIKGSWDEELHGMDYLVYAWLQKAGNDSARAQLNHLAGIKTVYPVNFKVAYAFAAMPARYFLENKDWKEAATLQMHPENFPWTKFPWQEAIIHFTRALGLSHLGNISGARHELETLHQLHNTLMKQQNMYSARQVLVQIKSCEAWIQHKSGHTREALLLMQQAADMEDSTEKHPVTPGEVIPARELLGDLLMELNQPGSALEAYEEVLTKSPGRFNSLYGAGQAAARTGNMQKAAHYYSILLKQTAGVNNNRPEIPDARKFMAKR